MIDDERCNRCGRQFSLDDSRRGEWEEFMGADGSLEWVCPHCMTDLDLQAIAHDLDDMEEELG